MAFRYLQDDEGGQKIEVEYSKNKKIDIIDRTCCIDKICIEAGIYTPEEGLTAELLRRYSIKEILNELEEE